MSIAGVARQPCTEAPPNTPNSLHHLVPGASSAVLRCQFCGKGLSKIVSLSASGGDEWRVWSKVSGSWFVVEEGSRADMILGANRRNSRAEKEKLVGEFVALPANEAPVNDG